MKPYNYFIYWFFISLFSMSNIVADFGDTCSMLVDGPSDNYLPNYTAYGHVRGNIDMVEYLKDKKDICNKDTLDIKFCFKLPVTDPPSPNVCTDTITIKVGDPPVALSKISGNSLISQDKPLQDLTLSVEQIANSICLKMPTSRGEVSIGCKTVDILVPPLPPMHIDPDDVCNNVGDSCKFITSLKSQSIFNFSGVTIDCLQESLNKIFFDTSNCPNPTFPSSSLSGTRISQILLTPFPKFQDNLRQSVRALLILYVMIWAAKIMLNPETMSANEATTAMLKILVVMYFATGFSSSSYDPKGGNAKGNGMLEYIVPLLPAATSQFATVVLNAAGSRHLCEFDVSRYQSGSEFYSLFDAMDCRVAYYFGMGILSGESPTPRPPPSVSDNRSSTTSNNVLDNGAIKDDTQPPPPAVLSNPLALRFFKVMSGMLFGGQILVFIIGIIFGVVFISLMIGFLSNYIVSLVTMYAMAYIGPIFIPMLLFKRTKGYYDGWLRIIVSCILQPAVKVGFIALLITLYDEVIYKTCVFTKIDDQEAGTGIKYSTFLLDPNNPDNMTDDCMSSPGYKLLDFYDGKNWETTDFLFFTFDTIAGNINLLEDFVFVGVVTYMAYFFSRSVNEFAAGITSGPNMDAVTISPGKIVDAAKQAMDTAIKISIAVVRIAAGDAGGAQDLAAEVGDKAREGIKDAIDPKIEEAAGGESNEKSESGDGNKKSGGGDSLGDKPGGGMPGGGSGGMPGGGSGGMPKV